MMARLGFIIAANIDPNNLIVDKILGVGDESFQKKCHERIEGFRRLGATVRLVTHDRPQVKSMCDRAYRLESGEYRASGQATAIAEQYDTNINP